MNLLPYAWYPLLGLALALVYVFLSSFLKPIGKHLAERLISSSRRTLQSTTESRSKQADSSEAPRDAERDLAIGLIKVVVDALKPGLTKLIEGISTTSYGLGAVASGIAVLVVTVVALLTGINLEVAALAMGPFLVAVGAFELLLGKRKTDAATKSKP